MPQFTGSLAKHPARTAMLWYLGGIVVGSIVLWQAFSGRHVGEKAITPTEAAFTATSALCVTGLAVRSTGDDFSFWGQLAILVLIQLGGLGIMTVTTFIMFVTSGRVGLRQKMIVAETLGGDPRADLKWVVRHVLVTTLAFEAAGFVLLAVRFLFSMPWRQALWHALFHSVSAFCNAGFSLNNNSLESYQGDVVVNVVIGALIVCGGIGFPVMLDIARNWRGTWRERWDGLHLHSKLMLIGTAALLTFGAAAFLLLEWNNNLQGLPIWRRVMAATFHSITCRTAGFNSMPMASMTNASLFVTILLMMIGAGPCSTGGGFKVSTLMVLAVFAWNAFYGNTTLNLFRRTLPMASVQRAVATLMLFAVLGGVALTTLLLVEQSILPHQQAQGVFLESTFEVVSALGTVGLSTGLTDELTTAGRWIVIGLMFAGRLGPISVFVALSHSGKQVRIQYPSEEPLLG
ncbi:MAG: hypothetical protein KDA41_06080 [Planctomycetales bacterium]|nr:hypothetical protein [Planctomycetales bacterium]